MKNKRITAALLLTLMLAACGGNSEPAVSETAISDSAAESTELTSAAEVSAESASTAESTAAETTESTTETAEEITSESTTTETTVDLRRERCFELYEPEIKEGVPAICDIDALKARRRTDMAEKYKALADESYLRYFDSEDYSDAADFAERYFKYSFDESSPTCSYVEDDFDLDGKNEYYLCMAEYVIVPYSVEQKTYDTAIVTSVYYIDDDGTEKNAFSRLVEMRIPEYLYGDTAEEALNNRLYFSDENNLMFQISCGYGSYSAPLVIDNGDSKHLFWKNDNSYPSDWGAEIFWLDKHCRVEISSPSSSLGGFYEWGEVPEELFFNERDKFGEDFRATSINLASKLDLYTYPEVSGKVNTMKWDGNNYVYDIIADPYDNKPESGPVEWD
ncbi:MAG: hypothetical protein J6A37_07895 [Oscillospiraceae bacterium]|nr:hypothetical protein [Oscillospiraceae bacterium]